MTLFIK